MLRIVHWPRRVWMGGGGGGSRAFWGGSFFPSNTLDRTLVYKCSKLSQRKPANRRRISGRRFSPSDFSRQVKLKPKTPDVLAGYHKGWGFPRGIYSEIHSPITIPEITCDPRTDVSLRGARSKYISTGPLCTVSKGWYCFLAREDKGTDKASPIHSHPIP